MIDFFIDYKASILLVHLLGAVIAICGAVISDTFFFDSVEDSKITPEEIRYIKRGGRIVICGLLILILSGVCIFFSDVERYSNSAKFLAKMTIVAILTANGFLFHLSHIPWLQYAVGKNMKTIPDFKIKRMELVMSGAVSTFSWMCAVTLAALHRVPYDYTTIMSVYVIGMFIFMAGALFLRKRLI